MTSLDKFFIPIPLDTLISNTDKKIGSVALSINANQIATVIQFLKSEKSFVKFLKLEITGHKTEMTNAYEQLKIFLSTDTKLWAISIQNGNKNPLPHGEPSNYYYFNELVLSEALLRNKTLKIFQIHCYQIKPTDVKIENFKENNALTKIELNATYFDNNFNSTNLLSSLNSTIYKQGFKTFFEPIDTFLNLKNNNFLINDYITLFNMLCHLFNESSLANDTARDNGKETAQEISRYAGILKTLSDAEYARELYLNLEKDPNNIKQLVDAAQFLSLNRSRLSELCTNLEKGTLNHHSQMELSSLSQGIVSFLSASFMKDYGSLLAYPIANHAMATIYESQLDLHKINNDALAWFETSILTAQHYLRTKDKNNVNFLRAACQRLISHYLEKTNDGSELVLKERETKGSLNTWDQLRENSHLLLLESQKTQKNPALISVLAYAQILIEFGNSLESKNEIKDFELICVLIITGWRLKLLNHLPLQDEIIPSLNEYIKPIFETATQSNIYTPGFNKHLHAFLFGNSKLWGNAKYFFKAVLYFHEATIIKDSVNKMDYLLKSIQSLYQSTDFTALESLLLIEIFKEDKKLNKAELINTKLPIWYQHLSNQKLTSEQNITAVRKILNKAFKSSWKYSGNNDNEFKMFFMKSNESQISDNKNNSDEPVKESKLEV